jgi:LEA14-like dessication related protein
MTFSRRTLIACITSTLLAACATPSAPPQVNVASVQPIEAGGMELRFVARLRVQNPNQAPLEFSGATAELKLYGKVIGTGVISVSGYVPPLGETFVDIPITVSGIGDVRQAIGLYGAPNRKLDTVLTGRLAGSRFDNLNFEWRGELAMTLPRGS